MSLENFGLSMIYFLFNLYYFK